MVPRWDRKCMNYILMTQYGRLGLTYMADSMQCIILGSVCTAFLAALGRRVLDGSRSSSDPSDACQPYLLTMVLHDERGRRWSSILTNNPGHHRTCPGNESRRLSCGSPTTHSNVDISGIYQKMPPLRRGGHHGLVRHRLYGHAPHINSAADEGIHNASHPFLNPKMQIVCTNGKMDDCENGVQKPLGQTHHAVPCSMYNTPLAGQAMVSVLQVCAYKGRA